MRWLIDECVDAALAADLRRSGHDVVELADLAPAATDDSVIELAKNESRLLLTEDKDFGELLFRRARHIPGIVLIRIDPQRRRLKSVRLRAAIDRLGDRLFGRYTVVEHSRFRSRPLNRPD
ncbi:MAG: DUF5615 family PIN-like protein [Rhodoplanes sp.]